MLYVIVPGFICKPLQTFVHFLHEAGIIHEQLRVNLLHTHRLIIAVEVDIEGILLVHIQAHHPSVFFEPHLVLSNINTSTCKIETVTHFEKCLPLIIKCLTLVYIEFMNNFIFKIFSHIQVNQVQNLWLANSLS